MASERLKLIKAKIQVKLRSAQRKAARELARAIPEVIKIRTRFEGESSNGRPLKQLEKPTKNRRRKFAANLHPDTDPDTSNLTATGQMLDAIIGTSSGIKVTIEIEDSQRTRELDDSEPIKTNKQIQRYVEKGGRPFLDLSKEEDKEALDLATQIIKEALSNITN